MNKLTDIMEREMKGCFDYFWNETNPENGITRDNTGIKQKDFGSIAAVGFALAAYPIGVSKGYITYSEGHERALNTMKAFYNLENVNGFFYHFITLSNGKRFRQCEVSIIDTALFLAGAVVSAEFFGGEAAELFEKIFERVNWQWLRDETDDMFYMGYIEEKGGFIKSKWNHYAEQFLMYVFGVASPSYPVNKSIFYSFKRWNTKCGEYEYIRSGPNALFVYQYSHAFLDFRGTVDEQGVDWFQNSVNATIAARQYCIDNEENSKTYSDVSWGLSACHYKHGYTGGFGIKPNGDPGAKKSYNKNDGTVAIYGAVASVAFTPEFASEAMENYSKYPELWGEYGFKDSYNLDEEPPYFDPLYLGIDKGISLVMLANYENSFVWGYFMKNKYILRGMESIGIKTNKNAGASNK